MQQCVVSDILIFFFQIHYIQGTLYEVMHGIGAKTGPSCICAETKIFQESIFARNQKKRLITILGYHLNL